MKISVTKEQQRAVEKAKEKYTLDLVLSHKGKGRVFGYEIDELNKATYEQIAAAWLGVAEVEPEYKTVEEIAPLLREGRKISFHTGHGEYEIYREYVIKKIFDCGVTFNDLFNGKFTVEDSK